jgi:aspartate carbamoyltransferase catalytic subunit
LLNKKDLLGIKELSVEEINLILDTAAGFKDVLGRDIKKVPALRGKTAVNLSLNPQGQGRTAKKAEYR